MTVTMIAARANRGDTVHMEFGPRTIDDYETQPGALVWIFTDGTQFRPNPCQTYRVDIP